MALLHRAELVPSKGDLVAAWLPGRPWAPSGPIISGVSYRLDDPDGEVGMEGFLLAADDGRTVHIPLTYRPQPLPGAEEHLLGTMEHSVLGTRWAYDGSHDPVWVATLAATIVGGGVQADEMFEVDGRLERRDPQVHLQGGGDAATRLPPVGDLHVDEDDATTTISCDFGDLVLVRRVGVTLDCEQVLTATWADHGASAVLAGVRLI